MFSLGFYWIDARGGSGRPIKVFCDGQSTCLYPENVDAAAVYFDISGQKFSQLDGGYRVNRKS